MVTDIEVRVINPATGEPLAATEPNEEAVDWLSVGLGGFLAVMVVVDLALLWDADWLWWRVLL